MKGEVVTRHIAGETILVPIRGKIVEMERLFALNRVGEFIWKQLDGHSTLQEICGRVEETFEVSQAQAWEDMLAFTAELIKADLIVTAD